MQFCTAMVGNRKGLKRGVLLVAMAVLVLTMSLFLGPPAQAGGEAEPILNVATRESPYPVVAGEILTYKIIYQNTGYATARNVVIAASYDSNAAFESADQAPDAGTDNEWTIGDLEPSATAYEILVELRADSGLKSGASIHNEVTMSADQTESVEYVSDALVAAAQEDPVLAIDVLATPNPVQSGGMLTFVLNYKNVGAGTANNVTVTMDYDPNLSFHSASIDPDAGTDNTWTIGTMESGYLSTHRVTTKVAPDTDPGTIVQNLASITSDETPEPVQSTAEIEIIAPKDLVIPNQTPEVVTVPFVGNELGVPHDTYLGREITLKGTAHEQTGDEHLAEYMWEFGDGHDTGWIAGVDPYRIEAKHTYTGVRANGTTYGAGTYLTAWLHVKDDTGSVSKDSYLVFIRDVSDAEKKLKVDVNIAIDEGLWYLHKSMLRGTYADGVEYGYWDAGHATSQTGAATEAFEIFGHLPGGDESENPYVETVQRGLNYLFANTKVKAIGPQAAGDPDTNGNGIGLGSYVDSSRDMYEVGITLMAIASSRAPGRPAETGDATWVKGRSYEDIAQDMIDYLAWGQNDSGSARGGWRYYANYGGSDNSVAQWPAIGMQAAEDNFGATVPGFVKTELDVWLNYTQDPVGGGFGYDGPGWYNVARAGAGAAMLSFVGVPVADARFQKALSYIDAHWNDGGGWQQHFDNFYAMYGVMKGMRLPHPDVDMIAAHDWYEEYAQHIVGDQMASGQWGSSLSQYHDPYLGTAWALLILQPDPIRPGPVADAGPDVNQFPPGVPLELDGSGSFHRDPTKNIVSYEWDIGCDGSWEYSNSPVVEHTFPVYYLPDGTIDWDQTAKDYDVCLRVTDDNDPPLDDTDSLIVEITRPPWKPVADPNGPYDTPKGVPVQLDGSGSYHPGDVLYDPGHPWYEEIATYEWDLDNDGQFDDCFDVTCIWVWPDKGVYPVSLKVTDSVASPPGQEHLDMDIASALVVVENTDPVADANGPYFLGPDLEVCFDGSGSYDPDGDPIIGYRWDFDSDGTWDTQWSGDPTACHTYPDREEYTATLEVYDGDGGYGLDAVTVSPAIPATIDCKPDTLNLPSQGMWITCYIELPEGHDVADIEARSILLNGAVDPVTIPKYGFAVSPPSYIVDHDDDGNLERMVKFSRYEVKKLFDGPVDEAVLTLTGEIINAETMQFAGTDVIKVIYGSQ